MRILLALLLCATPAFAQAPPQAAPKGELDQLLTALPMAPDEAAAARMEQRILELWQRSAGPTAALLMGRGARNLQAGDTVESVQDYDAVLALEPNFAGGYTSRAMAKYQSGNVSGAIADLEAALQREPRQFNAWRTLSSIAEDQQHLPQALEAWKKLLEIDPKTPGGAEHLKELTRKVEGEGA
jgi:tetratricopeptide (TPR) repeat protein